MLDYCLRLPDFNPWVPASFEVQQSESASPRHQFHISYILNTTAWSEARVALLWALPPALLLLDSVQVFADMRYCILDIQADARQSSSLAYAGYGATGRLPLH